MHEKRLLRQYSYGIQNYGIGNTGIQYSDQKRRKSISQKTIDKLTSINTLKLPYKNISYQIDYDLPLKQLQYTKTRKYKQNLNPVFQQLSTTSHRYDYFQKEKPHFDFHLKQTKQIPPKQYSLKNDYSLGNDRNLKNKSSNYQDNKPQYQNNYNQQKINQYKQRSRILSQNIVKKPKSALFSFGQLFYPIEKDRIQNNIDLKKTQKINFKNKESNKKIITQNQKLQKNSKIKKTQKTQRESQPTKLCSISNRKQLAQQYLQRMAQSCEKMQQQIKDDQKRLSMFRKQLQMHKQKNILKQKQLLLQQKQKIKIQTIFKQLKHQLQNKSNVCSELEQKHHKQYKALRKNKQQLKKEQNWLEQENIEIKAIEQKFQKLINMMKELQQEEDKREDLWREIDTQIQQNQDLKSYLTELDTKITYLSEQNYLVQEQTSTLETHHSQLKNLQLKFNKQTEKLLQSLEQLNFQINSQKQFISQKDQLQKLIRELQLSVGQLNEKKIFIDQEIEEINIKIGVKKRNVSHTQKVLNQKNFTRSPQIQNTQTQKNYNQLQKVFVRSKPGNQGIKIPLSTIRQQSKNTSAYQSPKPQESKPSFQQNSLQIDSRQVSRTVILKPHQEKDNLKKKYLIVESEEDSNSNNKSSFCFKDRNSDQLFISRQKKPSIEHRLIEQQFGGKSYEMERNVNNNNQNFLYKESTAFYQNPMDYESYGKKYSNSLQMQLNQQVNSRQKQKLKQAKQHKHVRIKRQLSNQKQEKKGTQRASNKQSEQVLQSLIERYQHIKSNSFFDQQWKQKR